jgi:hypothetical protein
MYVWEERELSKMDEESSWRPPGDGEILAAPTDK